MAGINEWRQIIECVNEGHIVALDSVLPRIKRAAVMITCWHCETSFSASATMNGRVAFGSKNKKHPQRLRDDGNSHA